MCYKFPGPRCSAHAKKKLQATEQTFLTSPSLTNYQAMQAAQEEFDITPEGRKALEARGNDETLPPDERFLAQDKLARATAEYDRRLALVKDNEPKPALVKPAQHFPPVTTAATALRQPSSIEYIDFSEDVATDIEYSGDYYSDHSVPEIRVTNVDTRKVLARIHHVDDSYITAEHVAEAEALGISDVSNYEATSVESDYYTDSTPIPVVSMKPELSEKLTEHYWKRPDADDDYSVLRYCRAKGQDTTGLPPLKAIQQQLRAENNNRSHSLVDNASSVKSGKIRLENITVPAKKHYEGVESREPKSPTDAPEVAGVVYKSARSDKYVLVDGYHRLKHLTGKKRKQARYIVLYGD